MTRRTRGLEQAGAHTASTEQRTHAIHTTHTADTAAQPAQPHAHAPTRAHHTQHSTSTLAHLVQTTHTTGPTPRTIVAAGRHAQSASQEPVRFTATVSRGWRAGDVERMMGLVLAAHVCIRAWCDWFCRGWFSVLFGFVVCWALIQRLRCWCAAGVCFDRLVALQHIVNYHNTCSSDTRMKLTKCHTTCKRDRRTFKEALVVFHTIQQPAYADCSHTSRCC